MKQPEESRKREAVLVTAAVPAYNVESYLNQCISSLILPEGLRERTEILIVDDGSTDGTAALADSWQKRYPDCVRVIHKENGGHGSAVNRGIAEAKGRYFRVIDGDDWAEPKEWEAYVRKLEEIDCDAVVTEYAIVTEQNGNVLTQEQKAELPRLCPGRCYPFERIARHSYLRMHELTFRTELLRSHGIRLRERSFYVDMQYILYPVPYLRTICVLPECVYRYRMGNEAQSVSRSSMQKNRRQHEAVLDDLLGFYRKQEEAGASGAELWYLAGGIARMQANQIKLYLSYPASKRWKQRIRRLERRIRRDYPLIHRRMPKQGVWLLRGSGYLLYPAASWLVRRR